MPRQFGIMSRPADVGGNHLPGSHNGAERSADSNSFAAGGSNAGRNGHCPDSDPPFAVAVTNSHELGGFLLFFALVGAPWFIVLGLVFFYLALFHY